MHWAQKKQLFPVLHVFYLCCVSVCLIYFAGQKAGNAMELHYFAWFIPIANYKYHRRPKFENFIRRHDVLFLQSNKKDRDANDQF